MGAEGAHRGVASGEGAQAHAAARHRCRDGAGAVKGWAAPRARFGRVPFARILAPAIQYAEIGFPVGDVVSVHWQDSEEALRRDAATAKTFLADGRVPQVGDMFRNPELAWTYRQIAAAGATAFYCGSVAAKLLASSKTHGGTMTAADLAEYEVEWVTPISTTYRGWTVYALSPNGQGSAALLMLNIMEQFPMASMGHNSTAALHHMIEAKKLAYADLQRYDADPRFATVPVNGLLSKTYAAERAKLVHATRANCTVPYGTPEGTDNGTTYLSAVDREGNMISFIQRNYSTGGWNQSQAHAQFVSNIEDFGMNIQGALDAPRFSKETFPGCDVNLAARIAASTRDALTAMGHQLVMRGDSSSTRMGAGQAVQRNRRTTLNA